MSDHLTIAFDLTTDAIRELTPKHSRHLLATLSEAELVHFATGVETQDLIEEFTGRFVNRLATDLGSQHRYWGAAHRAARGRAQHEWLADLASPEGLNLDKYCFGRWAAETLKRIDGFIFTIWQLGYEIEDRPLGPGGEARRVVVSYRPEEIEARRVARLLAAVLTGRTKAIMLECASIAPHIVPLNQNERSLLEGIAPHLPALHRRSEESRDNGQLEGLPGVIEQVRMAARADVGDVVAAMSADWEGTLEDLVVAAIAAVS